MNANFLTTWLWWLLFLLYLLILFWLLIFNSLFFQIVNPAIFLTCKFSLQSISILPDYRKSKNVLWKHLSVLSVWFHSFWRTNVWFLFYLFHVYILWHSCKAQYGLCGKHALHVIGLKAPLYLDMLFRLSTCHALLTFGCNISLYNLMEDFHELVTVSNKIPK